MLIAGPTVNQIQLSSRQELLGLNESIGHLPFLKSAFAISPLVVYSLAAVELNRHIANFPDFRRIVLDEILKGHKHIE